MLITDHNVML